MKNVLAGVALGGVLVILHFSAFVISLFTPGTPFHDSLNTMQPLAAGHPTKEEAKAWFDSAERVVLFGSVFVPTALGVLTAVVLISRKRLPSPETIAAMLCVYAVSALLFFGPNWHIALGITLFASVVVGGWFRRRQTLARSAA